MTDLPYRVDVEVTSDGSTTLYVPELDEHYHSIHGARTESEYIFIRHALQARLQAHPQKSEYSVLEIGFGTGLNALLTYQYLLNRTPEAHITYHTYEKYPIEGELIVQLFQNVLSPNELKFCASLHEAPWDTPVTLCSSFTIHKHSGDATALDFPPFDVLYMDAFSPENAPLLWEEAFLERLTHSAMPHATLSTYCAKGVIRRRLQGIGWETMRTPGPPGGKREILTACRKSVL